MEVNWQAPLGNISTRPIDLRKPVSPMVRMIVMVIQSFNFFFNSLPMTWNCCTTMSLAFLLPFVSNLTSPFNFMINISLFCWQRHLLCFLWRWHSSSTVLPCSCHWCFLTRCYWNSCVVLQLMLSQHQMHTLTHCIGPPPPFELCTVDKNSYTCISVVYIRFQPHVECEIYNCTINNIRDLILIVAVDTTFVVLVVVVRVWDEY